MSVFSGKVRLAAAEIDEDSVTAGSESIIKLPKHWAEKRGVEGKRRVGGQEGQRVESVLEKTQTLTFSPC